jgi:hypothetical protein
MATGTLSLAMSIGGVSITKQFALTADQATGFDPSIPPGYAGTLTTRTDNETGSVTMAAGHGITTGSAVDIYWSGGARFGVTVGTVSGNTVPIGADNSGTGDNLPVATTALVLSEQQEIAIAIDGDNAVLIGIELNFVDPSATSRGRLSLQDASDNEIAGFTLTGNYPRPFNISGGDTNPFTGNPITKGTISNSSTTSAATLKIGVLQDGTP